MKNLSLNQIPHQTLHQIPNLNPYATPTPTATTTTQVLTTLAPIQARQMLAAITSQSLPVKRETTTAPQTAILETIPTAKVSAEITSATKAKHVKVANPIAALADLPVAINPVSKAKTVKAAQMIAAHVTPAATEPAPPTAAKMLGHAQQTAKLHLPHSSQQQISTLYHKLTINQKHRLQSVFLYILKIKSLQ